MSEASIFLVSALLSLRHSDPYKKTGITDDSYTFIFVIIETFRDFQILLSFPITALHFCPVNAG